MSETSLKLYLESIGRIPLLTAAEEIQLGRCVIKWKRWEGGSDKAPAIVQRRGRRAHRRMMEANLRLVVTIARKYREPASQLGLELLDLVQDGSVGLSRAVDKFDPERGYKFSTYAYWWIRQSINRSLNMSVGGNRMIRVPGNAMSIYCKADRVRNAAVQASGRELTTEEIAKELTVSVESLRQVLFYVARSRTASLDAACNSDGSSFLELVADASQPELSERDYTKLLRALDALPCEEKAALELRFFHGQTQTELADFFGWTRTQVKQIQKAGMQKLRESLLSTSQSDWYR